MLWSRLWRARSERKCRAARNRIGHSTPSYPLIALFPSTFLFRAEKGKIKRKVANMMATLNLIVSVASAGAGLVAARNPAALSRSPNVSDGERFYQYMYTVRALAWELLGGALPFFFRNPAVTAVIAISAAVQFADAAIGLGRRDAGMATGALIAASVHALFVLDTLR